MQLPNTWDEFELLFKSRLTPEECKFLSLQLTVDNLTVLKSIDPSKEDYAALAMIEFRTLCVCMIRLIIDNDKTNDAKEKKQEQASLN